MASITVELEAFYGFGCGFQSFGSDDTVEIEVSDKELEALKKFGKEEITAEDVVEAIEGGDNTLEVLHEQLSEKFYYMVEEYWLFDADNECLYECLADHIELDISSGLYTPAESSATEQSQDSAEECDNESDDEEDYDDEDYESDYDLDAYHQWVLTHRDDHAFVAERVGLDLYACRDDEVNYTITID